MAVQKIFTVIKGSLGVIKDIPVEDRTTSSATAAINPGEPLKRYTNTDQYVLPLADGDPEVGTDIFLGVAYGTTSNEASATTEGEVDCELCGPGTQIRAFATTTSNINTAAKLADIQLDFIACDVAALTGTNGDFTLDENEGDDTNVHAFMIVGGDIVKGTLYSLCATSGWWADTA
jgi:hypothetical protein